MDPVNSYEDALPQDWRARIASPPAARYGSAECPNSPNACYCTGKCNLIHGGKVPFDYDALNKLKSRQPYMRPKALTPGLASPVSEAMNAMTTEARNMVALQKAELVKRIVAGTIDVGKNPMDSINTGEIIRPGKWDDNPNGATNTLPQPITKNQHMHWTNPTTPVPSTWPGILIPSGNTPAFVREHNAQQPVTPFVPLVKLPEDVFQPLDKVLTGLRSILLYKNRKYGNTALQPINVLSKGSTLEKLLARADDKIARIQNSEVLAKNDVCDLMGYLVLICAQQGWNDFSDQQD